MTHSNVMAEALPLTRWVTNTYLQLEYENKVVRLEKYLGIMLLNVFKEETVLGAYSEIQVGY